MPSTTVAEEFVATEIGSLPESWSVRRIGDVFEVQQGKALSPSARAGLAPRPFLRTANVLWGRLDLTALDQMDFDPDEVVKLALKPGDLLVCEGGEIGRAALWNGQVNGCLYQNHLHRLRASAPTVAPAFVMYWLRAAFLHLGLYGGIGNRTTIPNLSGARLKQLPIPLPPIKEQDGIARVLDRLQQAVVLQERTVATLRELKAATMAKLFREGLRGEQLEQTEIGEIPRRWEVHQLGDLATISTGTTPATERGDYYDGSVPFVKTAEIDDSLICTSKHAISEKAVEEYGLKIYPPGTVFLAMYGQGKTRGRAAYLAMAATTSQNTAAIEPGPSLDGQFAWHYLLSQYDVLRSLGNLGHLSHLNLGYVKTFRVPLPPIQEQVEIRDALAVIQTIRELHVRRLRTLEYLFSSMLHLLMTGQVRVPPEVITDQPCAKELRTSPPEVEEIVRRVVEVAATERVYLFGSGVPESPRAKDGVGLLVVMSFEGTSLGQAIRIEREVKPHFPVELIVRRPEDIGRALEYGDSFIMGIVERGRLVYASPTPPRRPEPRKPVERRAVSDELLQDVVRRIVEVAAPEKIILFGSAARGEMGPDSDLDFLVVKGGVHRRETANLIRRHLLDVAPGIPKDIIVVHPEDIERHRETIGYIIRPALREGRVLYAV